MFKNLVSPILERPVIHHIGVIAINRKQIEQTKTLLGLEEAYSGYVPAYQAECIFLVGQGPPIEFILSEQPALKNFNRGVGGIHHIAFQVPSIAELAEKLRLQEIAMLEPRPVQGAGPFVVNFLHPRVLGYTVEFVELINDDH
jgi:catechol 2,3-dioxygenase-like lactoylglutathione lyase family enzyme